ncbi:MAG: phage tail tape measure protein [Sedimentisphaeraceae bacterium JB056]
MSGSNDIKAGAAYVQLYVENSRFLRGLKSAQAKLKAFGAGTAKIGSLISAGAAAAGAPLLAAAKRFASFGDSIDKSSKRTGMSAESLSALGFAAEQSGSNMEQLENGIRRMQRTIEYAGDGLSTYTRALDKLGLSADSLKGLSTDQQFDLIAKSLNKIEDPSKKAAVAMEIFGRSGTSLLPMLDNLEALKQEAKELGLVIDSDQAASAAELTDAVNRVKRSVGALAFNVGSALADALTKAAKKITDFAVKTGKVIKENKSLILSIAKIIAITAGVGAALVAAGGIISGLASAVGGIITVIKTASSIFGALATAVSLLASPLALITAGLIAVSGYLVLTSEKGKAAIGSLSAMFAHLKEIAFTTLGGIKDALVSGDLSLAAKIAWLGIKAAFLEGASRVKAIWFSLRSKLLGVWEDIWFSMKEIAIKYDIAEPILKSFHRIQKAFKKVQQFFANHFAEIWAAFDPNIDADALKKAVNDSYSDDFKDLESQQKRQLDELNRQKRMGQSGREALREQQKVKHQQQAARDIAEVAHQLEQAKKDLEAASAEAKQKRASSEKDASKIEAIKNSGLPAMDMATSLTGGNNDALVSNRLLTIIPNKEASIAENTAEMVRQQKKTNRKLEGNTTSVFR